ncbi:hypothetical protein GGR52DRAFT_531157 [Hypoxylon sp. FL1284]|nr:hypothetical protein GGR52DRAFT_531157 [Hypoxylon sp. FL1284]
MFSYVVAGIAIFLFVCNPVLQYFSPQPSRLPRTPRPPINESLLAIDGPNQTAPDCPPDAYSIHIVSKAPLVIYIENFLSEDERAHLLEISEPLFEPSTVTSDGDTTRRDALVRDSEVAATPRTDAVRCVERRALAFQGWRRDLWLERLRTQRYRPAGHYAHHFDWGSGARGWGRVSSFMAWVHVDGGGDVGGGTEFPLLRREGGGGRWCRWVECAEGGEEGEGEGEGVTFKPVAGNAVFWENFMPDGSGRGWDESWHAGLPVKKGTKVGLNIWSWGRLS